MRHCSKPLRMTNSWLSPSGSWDLIRAGRTSLPLASSLHSYSLVKKVIDVVVVLFSIAKIEKFQPLPTTLTHFFTFLVKNRGITTCRFCRFSQKIRLDQSKLDWYRSKIRLL